jgi:hypothetical protein
MNGESFGRHTNSIWLCRQHIRALRHFTPQTVFMSYRPNRSRSFQRRMAICPQVPQTHVDHPVFGV